jgi:uncharacterized iron-regulated membrane protein
MTALERLVRQPQHLWLRRALFQVHLWIGIGLGLYIVVICVTGSVLVYRNELYTAATPTPIIAAVAGERLTDDRLKERAVAAYPGYQVTNLFRARNRDAAVDIWLKRGPETRKRLFDPYTGKDVGDSVSLGIRSVSWLLDLHDNLLSGPVGRTVNGFCGLLVTVLGLTGLMIWWPGIQRWRRSLTVHRRVGWKRLNWDLHSAIGFWTVLSVLMFGITGAYLGIPGPFAAVVDFLEPSTDANLGSRLGDGVLYWLAYAHFGRFGGRSTKLLWAALGLVPVVLFVTGALMWWNRVLRRDAGPELSS